MKEALETIDLLAGVSANSTVMFDTIFSAVKRGQVVSVAVLLLLARDRVMQSHFFATNISRSTYMPFPESIMNELSALMNQESALMGCKEHSKILQLCREKELMMYFLQMIEIFNRAGTDLKSYLETRTSDVTNEQVSYHVAELLKEAGFILSTNDSDISDITSSPKLGQVPLDATVKQQEYEDDPEGIFFKPCREQLCRCDMKIPSCTTSNVFQRIVGPTLLHNHHRGFSSRAGPSIDQPLCTVPRRNICFLSRLPNVFGEVGPCDKSGDNVSLHKQQITVKLTDDSLEGSKDESKANTVAPQYLKNSLFYVEPSKFQPSGLFKSPMPRGRIAALKAGFKAFEHVDVKKISASVFSFIK